MQYSFTYNQLGAIRYNEKNPNAKIDLKDLHIITLISNLSEKWEQMEKITVNNRDFFWLAYEKIKEELPLIHLNKSALGKRFRRLDKTCNLIERFYDIKEQKNYVRLSEKGNEIINLRNSICTTNGIQSASPRDENPHNKNTNYKNIKDKRENSLSNFDFLNNKYPIEVRGLLKTIKNNKTEKAIKYFNAKKLKNPILKDFESFLEDWNKNEINNIIIEDLPKSHPTRKRIQI